MSIKKSGCIVKATLAEGEKIHRNTPSENQESTGKRGVKVDIAHELENGEIIYVPE